MAPSIATAKSNRPGPTVRSCEARSGWYVVAWCGNRPLQTIGRFHAYSEARDWMTLESCEACAYETPRSLTSRTASSLNSRVNFRLSMTHLRFH